MMTWVFEDRMGQYSFWVLLFALILVPLLWIVDVSLQAGDAAMKTGYLLLPRDISFTNYKEVLIANSNGIRSALGYSFVISSLSCFISILVSFCASYLITAEVVSPKWRRAALSGAVGLYFLPAFTVYPGLRVMGRVLPVFKRTTIQLLLVDSMFGFATAFVLLLLVYSSVPRSEFEQLLLETRSRFQAFWKGIARPQIVATIVVAAVTFSSIWSEFFIANLITGADTRKPFAVILQMAAKQYSTEYSTFASGAILSLLVCLIPFLGMLCVLAIARPVGRRLRRAA
jgi:ABC-type glycerol-3-phosphate transport system permease component